MAHPNNVPSSVGFPGGAPGSAAAVALYLAQLVSSLNNWVAQAANAINFSIIQSAPAHNTSPGTAGQLAYDSGFLYVCIATNRWARVAIGGSW